MYIFTVILRAVARDMLYANANDWRIRAGVVLDRLKPFQFLLESLSLLSFISSSLLFASVLLRVLCCCVFCAVLCCVVVCRCVVSLD